MRSRWQQVAAGGSRWQHRRCTAGAVGLMIGAKCIRRSTAGVSGQAGCCRAGQLRARAAGAGAWAWARGWFRRTQRVHALRCAPDQPPPLPPPTWYRLESGCSACTPPSGTPAAAAAASVSALAADLPHTTPTTKAISGSPIARDSCSRAAQGAQHQGPRSWAPPSGRVDAA
jgi:hypothetical protein